MLVHMSFEEDSFTTGHLFGFRQCWRRAEKGSLCRVVERKHVFWEACVRFLWGAPFMQLPWGGPGTRPLGFVENSWARVHSSSVGFAELASYTRALLSS